MEKEKTGGRTGISQTDFTEQATSGLAEKVAVTIVIEQKAALLLVSICGTRLTSSGYS